MDRYLQRELSLKNMTISKLRLPRGRNDFASTEEGIFCHCSALVGCKMSLEEISCDVVVKYHETDRGLTASWFCPLPLIDEKTKIIIEEAQRKATLEREMVEAWREAQAKAEAERLAKAEAEAKAKAERIERKIKSLVGEYKEVVKENTSYYGGSKYLEFIFLQKNIDKETFKEFLSLKDLVVEAKPCYYPISPEKVEFYPINNGWVYKWQGEWSD